MTATYDILVWGRGRMASALKSVLSHSTMTYIVVDSTSNSDNTARCIVDFSRHSNTNKIIEYARKTGTPLVIGTTGQDETEKSLIKVASQHIPILIDSNFSLGIATVKALLASMSTLCDWQIDIIDYHRFGKQDSPSGTALSIAELISNRTGQDIINSNRSADKQIVLHSVRSGTQLGRHDIILAREHETITISHCCTDIRLFCQGALECAEWLIEQPPRLYCMQDYLISQN
ncbi:MAG: 4-hydroxy-tetrahydrodipicolinate reductase [Clostridia bacterium]|nr:4-hydroxy-tetrahydrodipicolinate reductase [Clostridia bacterium]